MKIALSDDHTGEKLSHQAPLTLCLRYPDFFIYIYMKVNMDLNPTV